MKLIYFDGMSGSGKGTQINLVKLSTQAADLDFKVFREPTSLLRPFIKSYRQQDNNNLLTQALIFAADRAHYYMNDIKPLEKTNHIVYIDRSKYSSIYQISKEMPLEKLLELNSFYPNPDSALIFTLPPEQAYTRILERHKREGTPISRTENIIDLTNLRAKYEVIPTFDKNAVIIDSSQTIGKMHKNVINEQ